MKVKYAFKWIRNFSADSDPIEIPAGAPVEYSFKNKQHYVRPEFFSKSPILHHDATHYGCRVDEDNIETPMPINEEYKPDPLEIRKKKIEDAMIGDVDKFSDFYFDVLPELSKFGTILQFKVSTLYY
jgi:hypothetical protein